jgi:hypothetical protein
MARLSNKKMAFEITFSRYNDGWIIYEIKFLWDGESIINDDVLKRDTEYWNQRNKGAFITTDDYDKLIPFIERILRTEMPDYWQPIEPDVTIEIYPVDLNLYPPIASHISMISIEDNPPNEIEKRKMLKRKLGQLDDDLFTVVVRIDAYNFKNEETYHTFGTDYGASISMLVEVTRNDLKQFVDSLRLEYKDFCTKYGIKPHKLQTQKDKCLKYIKELRNECIESLDSRFLPGRWVKHFYFGEGLIIKKEGDKLTVKFSGYGLKRFDLKYADFISLNQRQYRRLFFESHRFHSKDQYICPCCCYPTLIGVREQEVCFLCGWTNSIQLYWNEQDDHNADEILYSHNNGYSLTRARENFEAHTTMFSPDDISPYAKQFFLPEIVTIKKRIKSYFDFLPLTWDKEVIACIWEEIDKNLKDIETALSRYR